MLPKKYLPVAVLIGSKVHTMIIISNSIGVVICWRNIGVNWSSSISWWGSRGINWSWWRCWLVDWYWRRGRPVDRGRSWGILRSSRCQSQEGKQSNKALKRFDIIFLLATH
jgi:hypothetical protein